MILDVVKFLTIVVFLLCSNFNHAVASKNANNQSEQQLEKQRLQYLNMTAEEMHRLPKINAYWAKHYLDNWYRTVFDHPNAEGFPSAAIRYHRIIIKKLGKSKSTLNIASIGSGACSDEIELVKLLVSEGIKVSIVVNDINEGQMKLCKQSVEAASLGQYFTYKTKGVKDFSQYLVIQQHKYDVILALWSMHHMVELEIIIDAIYTSLSDTGIFGVEEMIGRNGHMRWPEAESILRPFWILLPHRLKFSRYDMKYMTEFRSIDYSKEGNEGIRSQDILSLLLLKHFHFEKFLAYGSLLDMFRDREYGFNMDINNHYDRGIVDFLQTLEDSLILKDILKPTHMFAILSKDKNIPSISRPGISAEFSVRKVD